MTNWNAILSTPHMRKTSIDFAHGILSKNDYHEMSSVMGCGGHVRTLVRNNGSSKAREMARKALKRRNILDRHNLVNPRGYAHM